MSLLLAQSSAKEMGRLEAPARLSRLKSLFTILANVIVAWNKCDFSRQHRKSASGGREPELGVSYLQHLLFSPKLEIFRIGRIPLSVSFFSHLFLWALHVYHYTAPSPHEIFHPSPRKCMRAHLNKAVVLAVPLQESSHTHPGTSPPTTHLHQVIALSQRA